MGIMSRRRQTAEQQKSRQAAALDKLEQKIDAKTASKPVEKKPRKERGK